MEISEAGLLTFIHLEVDTDKLVEFFQSLDEAIEAGIPELHKRFAETLAERAEKAFDEEGYPTKWVPSAAAQKEGRKTLQKTKRLMYSFTDPQSPDKFVIASGGYLLWGSNVPYAMFQTDEDFAPVHRPVIVFDNDLKEELGDDMREWMSDLIADPRRASQQ